MTQTVIEYRPSLFYPPRSGPYIAGKITFVPGVKAYSSSDWQDLLSHPTLSESINDCLQEGIFRVVSESKPQGGTETLTLPNNQAQAIALVKKTYSLSLLQSWQKAEARKPVLDAIAAQMKVDTPTTNVPPPKELGEKEE
ncbi:MAG: hypothetical protein AB1589_18590 [Cyanobacteriota bacterium]